MSATYRTLFLFAGLGGGALGFQRAQSSLGGRMTIAGAVDFEPGAARDFETLTGQPCTVADLSTMTLDELRAACPGGCPDVVFTSPPCKSFSGCMPAATAATPKYVDMADLAVRGLFLALEAWEAKPRLILLENVPRIQNRGRHLLNVIIGMLRSYGYAVRETVHDCGELGGLAQRRRRFLLVARHVATTGDWWREPPKRRVRGIGEVLGALPLPLPGSTDGGPMHRLPRLSAMNWLRLALIPAGGDWRDLPESVQLAPRAGRQNGGFGVENWSAAAHAVLAEGSVANTRAAVADPRPGYDSRNGHHLQAWDATAKTVIGHDPRGLKGAAVADPRMTCEPRNTVMGVVAGDEPSGAVLGAASHDNGAFSVADPRVQCERNEGGHGVQSWSKPAPTVIGHPTIHNWPAAAADPRGAGYQIGQVVKTPEGLAVVGVELDLSDPGPMSNPPIILALDGTWHRPMTTLELAALQSLPVGGPGAWLVLDGKNAGHWRERIGNAVPADTAEAIAGTALTCLVSSDAGGLTLGCEPVWVSPGSEVHA
jgi:site-specific DNA-cytosine methylase